MSQSSENSGDEGDRTMTPGKNDLNELRQQISQLQLALESSERERIELQQVISRQHNLSSPNTTNEKRKEAVSVDVVSTVADITSTTASYATSSRSFGTNHKIASENNTACAYVNSAAAAHGMYTNYNNSYNAHAFAYNTTRAHVGTNPNQYLVYSTSGGHPLPSNFSLVNPTANFANNNGNLLPPVAPSIHSAGAPNVSNSISPIVPIVSYTQSPLGLGSHQPIRKVLDLPEFHGSPEEWPMFSVAYKETTILYAYTDLENLLRLQKALKSKARQQVESLLIHPSNVSVLMRTLEHHFGRPEILVRSQIAKARAFPVVKSEQISDIINFSTMVANLTAFLESSGASPHLNNPILLDELLSKLPFNKREDWTRHILALKQPYPTVRDFSDWLQNVALFVSMATDVMPAKQSANEIVISKSKSSTKPVMSINKDDHKCPMCSENHHLFRCQQFKAAENSHKWNVVKKNNLCFSCLQPGHSLNSCSKRRQCGMQACNRFHNRLLHKDNSNKNTNEVSNVDNNSVATVSGFQTSQHANDTCKQRTLLKYLPVKLKGPKGEVTVLAFIDEGAKISLLEEGIANALGVKGKTDMLRLKWIGNQTTSEHSRRVSFEITGVFADSSTHQMSGVQTTKKLYLPQQILGLSDFIRENDQLRTENISDYRNMSPQLLIGLPHTHLVRPIGIINIDEGFAAHKTKLGWTIFGSNEECATDYTVGHVNVEMLDLYEINKHVAEYFVAENFEAKSVPIVRSNADTRAETLLRNTTKFINGRYETGLLWQRENISLPQSYTNAFNRLKQIESKLNADADYRDWYAGKINEYVDKGYAKKLTVDEANKVDERTWYLPHFAACNPNKGNKRRLVFDAAAKVNEISLNSVLMKGPAEYQPKSLLTILLQFRQGKIAVCGDIREMFHRVLIRHEDQSSQRFLWRGANNLQPPDVYVMSVMIFGSVSSPCSAQYVKNLNAEAFRSTYPRAVNAIVERHYVDDYMDSFDDVDDAVKVTKKVIEIHDKGGFELRNIISNSDEIMQAVEGRSAQLAQNDVSTCKGGAATEKVLGMHWRPKEDYFCFILSFARVPKAVLDGTRRPTKGEMLSVSMSIFDPFGLLCSSTLCSKVLLQRLWQRNVDWHEQIPDDIYDKWYEWYKGLKTIEELKVQRCYHPQFLNDKADIQLHVFVDASELAFAAVAYWRIQCNNETSVAFIAGRSRCSPLKLLSIPRLELQSAVLGVRLKETIANSHDVKPSKIVYWTDSKTVIQWLRSDSRCYKQFVAHRISEVLQSSEVAQWRWVPGSENPADDATRPKVFRSNCRWVSGPNFLKWNEDRWPLVPRDPCERENDVELRSKTLYTMHVDKITIPYAKFTNLYKFLRIMTWVRIASLKFRALARKQDFTVPKVISAVQIKQTEILICRLVQEAEFADEMKNLRTGRPVNKNSSLYKLCPTLDEDGVMRLGGRIDFANCVSASTKRPIILPKSHLFSRMVARHHHEMFHHHNFEAALATIRYKYCIPNVRRLLRSVKIECQLCKNLSAVPETPLMGQLPKDRLTPFVRPFSYTGVDYFGPVMVSIGRRHEKRWVAIFTCLTVRAIHLELAKDLSTDAAIIVCRNFINRRGVPVRMRSDRGTNFVGASKEMWVEVDKGIGDECCRRGIEWLFNAPANPSAGGVWERMVRTVKRVLQFTLKEKAPQVETLQSLLIEAENLVNSRPLTHVPLDSSDDEPLTPNHFLVGYPNFVQAAEVSEVGCLKKQWHISQQLKRTFWKRWVLEYLPTLTRRTKWFKRVKPVCVGDVVIICDDNESRGQWKRGIIVEAKAAADGQVRSVLVKTQMGKLRRPVSKIAVLDVKGDSLVSDSNHGEENVADKI